MPASSRPSITANRPHDDEAALVERVPRLVADGLLRATTDDAAGVRESEVVVVIVPVVVDEARRVDFSHIDAATRDLAGGLQPGTLVIYETTLPIGTTRIRLGPMLEAGSGLRAGADFHLAFSPERVLVGRVLLDLARYPKIVGGTTEEATRRAVAFYEAALEPGTEIRALASAEAAEMTKLAETTYRDVNIALANEFAQVAARRGIDVTEVIAAANSQPYSHIHQPGVGVGGHCIPVYPHLLFSAEPDMQLPPVARAVNDGMAAYAVGMLGEALGTLAGRQRPGPGHRLPRRRARGLLQQRVRPARCADRARGARVLRARPLLRRRAPPAPRLRAVRPCRADPGTRGRSSRLPMRPTAISTCGPSPAWRSCWTVATRWTDQQVEAAGVRYIGVGR